MLKKILTMVWFLLDPVKSLKKSFTKKELEEMGVVLAD